MTIAPEDLELVRLAQAGDREAHHALAGRWRHCARAAVGRYLRRCPWHLPYREDLEAEGWLALYLAIPRYDPARGMRLSSYLIRWAYYAIASHGDSRACRPTAAGPLDDDDQVAAPEPPADAAELAEAAGLLGPLLDRLGPRERAVVRLWYGLDPVPGLEGAPARTAARPSALIARHLGLSRERVRQIHRDALARLRAWAGRPCEAPVGPV